MRRVNTWTHEHINMCATPNYTAHTHIDEHMSAETSDAGNYEKGLSENIK